MDWQEVMNSAMRSDIVVTAPGFVGQATDRQELDNQYNGAFAERLARDPHFRGPIRIQMGRFEPVGVLAFVNSSLACRSEEKTRAKL